MNKIKIIPIATYILCCLSLFLSFHLGEDGSGTPLSGDFRDTWPYVLKLTENFFIDPSPWTLHFPMHYFILSKLYTLFDNIILVRISILIFSLLLPILFYICLKTLNQNSNKIAIWLLSLTLFFTPSFRYSAIWANDQITFYFFVFLGTFFFLKAKKNYEKNPKKNFHIYLYLLCFALSCYSRQFYSVLYGLFLIDIYKKYDWKNFIYFSILSTLLALPGLLFLVKYPSIFGGLVFSGNIFNTVFGNISALLIYTFPIFLLNLKIFKQEKKSEILKKFLLSILFFLIVYFFSDTNSMSLNGGLIFFFSNKIFNNLFIFYLSFILSIFIIFIIFNNKDKALLTVIILMIAGIIVLPKYFEPLFMIFFLFYSSSKYKDIFFKNSSVSFVMLLYYFIYYIACVSDIFYQL